MNREAPLSLLKEADHRDDADDHRSHEKKLDDLEAPIRAQLHRLNQGVRKRRDDPREDQQGDAVRPTQRVLEARHQTPVSREPRRYQFSRGEEPALPLRELEELGYCIILYPADVQRAAIRAMSDVLATIMRDGHSAAMRSRLALAEERDALVDTNAYLALSERYRA